MYNLNVSATNINNMGNGIIGANLFVPAPAHDLYEVVLDVKGFPKWAPGVRRVEITQGMVGAGMVSEWEVSLLGVRRKISSVLEEAEPPRFLRWTYEGLIRGWGECSIKSWGDSALAEFKTELCPTEPALEKLMRTVPFRNIATHHLKRCLTRLGQEVVSGNRGRVRVGPLKQLVQERPNLSTRAS